MEESHCENGDFLLFVKKWMVSGRKSMWMVVAFFCAAYVFVGMVVISVVTTTGNWVLIGLALIAYVLNVALLCYAKKKPW